MTEGMRIRVVRVSVYGSEIVSVPTYVGFDSDALNFNRVAHYLPLHNGGQLELNELGIGGLRKSAIAHLTKREITFELNFHLIQQT